MNKMITSTEIKDFKEKGFVVIKNLFSQEEVEEINKEYANHWLSLVSRGEIVQDQKKPASSLFPRIYNLDRQNTSLQKYTLDSRFFDSLKSLINEEGLLIASSYFFKAPGDKGLPMHQDDFVFGIEPGTVYSLWLSLDYADKENGCLNFAVGSQDEELILPKKKEDNELSYFSDEGRGISVPDKYTEIVDVYTEPGDLVIFNGTSIHGSYDNISDNRFRRCLLLQFAGVSVEKLLLNFNNLLNRKGERVRRRLNTNPTITSDQKSVFAAKEGKYFDKDTWKK